MKKIYDRRNIFTFPARGGRGPDLGYDDDDDTLGDDSVGGVNDDGEGPDDDVPDYAAMSVEELKAYRDDLSAKLAAERESGAELEKKYADVRKAERTAYFETKSRSSLHISGILLEITCFAFGIAIGELIIWALRN
jgi:hypothetical protein